MNKVAQLYRFLNVMSLDVVVGAVVSAGFFAEIFNIQVLPKGLACLGLSVWIIYTVDHLTDARRVTAPAATYRHRFHQINRRWIGWLLLVAILVDCALIFFIRKPLLQWGMALSVAVVAYFLLQRYLKYIKEFCVALLYCLGVLLPALALSDEPVFFSRGLLIIQFGLVVLSNLILFSFFDVQRDLQDFQHSFATVGGKRTTRKVLTVLFMVSIALLVVQFFFGQRPFNLLIIFLMNVPLLVMFLFPVKFEASDRYRLLGDAVFFVPAIIWL